ncbi:MAG: GNAT family N-acetyltransferase [Bacteriovorax sp.]
MDYLLKHIDESEIENVQRIFEEAPTYSLRAEGTMPKRDAAIMAFKEMPPDFDKTNKYCFGFYKDESLIGFIDILNGYPEKSIAYLGLLLLSEAHQKKGMGSIAYQLLEAEVRKWNSTKIRLAVAESNDVSGFWSKMGFRPTGRILTAHNPDIISQVIEMEKIL